MHTITCVLTCLVCSAHGHRVKVFDEQGSQKLAKALLGLNPTAAFNPSSALGARLPASTKRVDTKATTRVGTAGPQMATIAELRDRITSVQNTAKITKAMKLVAAAKVRKAQEACINMRPGAAAVEKMLGGLLKKIATEMLDIPLMEERPVKTVGLVTVSADRGLCGGYNSKIIKATQARIAELESQGLKVRLFLLGNKNQVFFGKRPTPIAFSVKCTQAPSGDLAQKVMDQLIKEFTEETIDSVEVIYTQFISMIAAEVTTDSLLPLTDINLKGSAGVKLTTKDGQPAVAREDIPAEDPMEITPDTIFEQEPSSIINGLLPLYLNGQMLKFMQEGVASELAARMTAMQSATDNANDLAGRLTTEMNRARQAKVTTEILEIISGAEATAQ